MYVLVNHHIDAGNHGELSALILMKKSVWDQVVGQTYSGCIGKYGEFTGTVGSTEHEDFETWKVTELTLFQVVVLSTIFGFEVNKLTDTIYKSEIRETVVPHVTLSGYCPLYNIHWDDDEEDEYGY